MSPAINGLYRFGEFTVDRQQKVLSRNGSPLPLAPKVFDTLLILIDNNGRIVEKKELMNRLWPDTFVEESNLTFNIQQLRKALGDDARRPRFIETVARRGYRFIAEVNGNPSSSAANTELNSSSLALSPPAGKKSYLWIAALAVLVIGVVAIIWWFGQRRFANPVSSAPILSRPFKSEKFATGGFVSAAITPDGKYVAYTSETGGKESVWLRQLATSENIQIVPPSDETYLGLTISHDGNSLYFVRKTSKDAQTAAVYRVMTFGGIPVKIIDNVQGTISLSPDDKHVSFTRCHYREDDFCSLYVVDIDSGNERKVLTRKEPIRLVGGQFSPDGKSIAFASGQSWNGGSDFHLMRLDLASATESALASRSFFNIRSLRWLPDGDGLLFTANESLDGRFKIWYVSTATGEARVLTKDASDYYSLSLNQAADKLIATYVSDTFHLYLARIDDLNNPKSLAIARTGFAFAPDGRIIYEGNDGDLWKINQDGAERRQLTNNPFSDVLPCTSPDGRYVFFTSNRTGSSQVWRMGSDGTNQIQVTKREGGYPKFVTPDGKWVYFESGLHRNLWRVPTESGQESQVLEGPLYNPVFSPDGKWVAYLFRAPSDGSRFSLAVNSLLEPQTRRLYKLSDDKSRLLCVAWGLDNETFYYVSVDGFRNSLWRQSLADEKPLFVGDLGADEVTHLAVSPDGTSFAFIRGRWIHDAVLIEGLK